MSSLVEISEIVPDVRLDLRYGTTNNITGRILYPEPRAFLLADVARALVKVQADLESDDLGLVIWDAYRPRSVSQALWEVTPEEQKRYVADPTIGSDHNKGAAVDSSLYNLRSGEPVDMPTDFDDFSESAWPNFEEPDEKRRTNRDLLIARMATHGLLVYEHEWWHFRWHESDKYPVLDTPIEAL
jgi:D-alanyl-D-alanine dipeptidase